MSDTQGNTPQDRRTVALSEEHELRHFVEQFVRNHPGVEIREVVDALDRAAASIAPSEDRQRLTDALERALNIEPLKQ